MNIIDLFQLSLLSRRAKRCIRASFGKNSVHLDCKMGGQLVIDWNGGTVCTGYAGNAQSRSYEIYLQRFLISTEDDELCCGWRRGVRMNGKRMSTFPLQFALLEHIVELFNKPTVSVKFGDQIYTMNMLEYIRQQQLPLDIIEFGRHHEPSEEDLVYMMNECKGAKELDVRSIEPPEKFLYLPAYPHDFQLDKLTVESDDWINLEDFMECKSIQIEYSVSLFTRYSAFFNTWVNSDCRLESVLWENWKFYDKFETIFEGLGNVKIQSGVKTIRLVRPDGKTALVECENGTLSMQCV